jgi:hypothetical protein
MVNGQFGASDYTKHKDPERKERYIDRHKNNESWGKDDIDTADWLSHFIIWEKPSLKGAIDNAVNKYSGVKYFLNKF